MKSVRGLRKRLVVLLVVSVLPAITAVLWMEWVGYQQDLRRAFDELRIRVELARSRELAVFDQSRELLAVIASFPAVQEHGTDHCDDILARMFTDSRRFKSAGVIDGRGKLTCRAGRPGFDANSSAALLLDKKEPGQTFLHFYEQDKADGKPALIAALPLQPAAANPGGFAFVEFDLGELNAIAGRLRGKTEWAITVAMRDRRVIGRAPNPELWFGKRVLDSVFVERAFSTRTGVSEATGLDGTWRLLAYTSAGPNDELRLIMSIPKSEFIRGFQSGVLRSLGVILFAFLMLLGISLTLADRWLVLPLKALQAAAARISGGDFTHRAPETAVIEEVRELSRRFNSMAESIDFTLTVMKASERRYRTLVEATSQVVFSAAPDGSIVTVSPSWQELTGQSAEAAIGHGWKAVAHPDDIEIVHSAWTRAMANMSPCRVEYRVKGKDGNFHFLQQTAVPVVASTGELLEWIGVCTDVTDTRKAERELRESELKFATLFGKSAVPTGLLRLPRGEFVDINEACVRHFGYSKEEVIGKTSLEIGLSRDPAERHASYEDLVRTGEVVDRELTVYTKAGAPLSGFTTLCVVRIGDEDFILSSWQDITELKKSLRASGESEERLSLALDAAHMGIFDWDVVKGHIAWSKWHEELWGMQPGEFDGTYAMFASRVHSDDLARVNATVERCLAERSRFHEEFRVVWPDRSEHWMAGRGEFIYEGDQPVRMRGVVVEVTERHQMEEELRQSEQRYRSLIEATAQVVWTAGPDGNITSATNLWQEYTGQESEQLKGWGWLDAVHPEDRERVRATWQAAVYTGAPLVVEYRTLSPDGGIAYFEVHAVPARSAAGAVIEWVGICVDITPRQLALEDLRRLSARLLRLQDEERRRIARELHDSTGQELAALCMQLSTVVRSAETLRQKERDALRSARQLADEALAGIRTLSYLLHPPLLEAAGLGAALEWLGEGLARRSGIKVSLDLPDQIPRFQSEVELAVFRIAQESLANVFRHSGSKSATVRLRIGEKLLLEVEDEGSGLSIHNESRLEPMIESLGVGITGMRERARQLGGELRITSRVPKGTLVRLQLPSKERSDEAAHSAG